jgi:hypothetical protein
MDCLKSVTKSFYYFNRFILPIGFGARTLLTKGEGPACNLFAMSGDFMDPFVESAEELTNCYKGTIKSVKLALPVIYKQVIKFVCDLARAELDGGSDITQLRNYYVLTLLMAGMIDDF